MVSTENLKVLDHETEIYTPVHNYGDALKFILKQNNIDVNITLIMSRFTSEEDEKTRTYWAEKFKKAGNHKFIAPRVMLRFRTYFDTEELFNFLMDSMTDADVQQYIAMFASGPHIPDPNTVE